MIDPTDADIGRAVLYRDAGQAYDGERTTQARCGRLWDRPRQRTFAR
jgi:hypothetical protein